MPLRDPWTTVLLTSAGTFVTLVLRVNLSPDTPLQREWIPRILNLDCILMMKAAFVCGSWSTFTTSMSYVPVGSLFLIVGIIRMRIQT
jgi:hypothetical protein